MIIHTTYPQWVGSITFIFYVMTLQITIGVTYYVRVT